MSLRKSLKEIKDFLLERYKDNLAAILVFGSANTGEFTEGKSDIDVIILLNKKEGTDFEKEKSFLFNKLRKYRFSPSYFIDLKSYEKYIYKKGSWPHWIIIIDGSKKIYSTKEFKKFKKRLIEKPISKKKLINYFPMKDWRISHVYPNRRKGFGLTKGLLANLRSRMQVLDYVKYKKVMFSFDRCLKKLKVPKRERKLIKRLHKYYRIRKKVTKKEFQDYKKLMKGLTKKIVKELKHQ